MSFLLRDSSAFLLGLFLSLLASTTPAQSTVSGALHRATEFPQSPKTIRFAVIGDFGEDGVPEADVAALVHAWKPDLVVTVGDNNYHEGEASTIDANIGKHYQDFIAPYLGSYGPGATRNRFFPVPGNHDWRAPGLTPYLDYFTLPGNERYYDFVRGPVHFFMVDSDDAEPDGVAADSVQGQAMQAAMASSSSPFRFVLLHHAPFSSADHGPTLDLQWPFAAWGADATFAGHDHVYERFSADGLAHFVNGLGGRKKIYTFQPAIAGSRARFNGDYGAMLVDVDAELADIRFVSRTGIVLDRHPVLAHDPMTPEEFLVAGGSVWKYLDTGADPGATWAAPTFDDTAWLAGPAQLGYDEGDEATLVSYGPDSAHKYITTYFRREFSVSSPSSITELRLDLLADDGAVVYLNGVEVHRVNLPTGPVAPDTLASAAVADDAEDSHYETALDPSLLVPGVNQLAVELHQVSASSSDISFDLKLSAFRDSAVLVPSGSTWRFLDTDQVPAPSWKSASFDDTAWLGGPAPLGYGDGDEATPVAPGPDPLDKTRTTYFRHTFAVADPSVWNGLLLRLERDAGAIVSLNGAEVHRFNLPLTGVAHDTFAGYSVEGEDESLYFESRLLPTGFAAGGVAAGGLVAGTNVLAVEIHRATPDGPDLSFDLELLGRP